MAWAGGCASTVDDFRFGRSPDTDGRVTYVTASTDDTLIDLAREYGLGYTETVAANPGIDPWLPGAGTRLLLPTGHLLPPGRREGIVINLAEQRLYFFPSEAAERQEVLSYPIGVARDGWTTPLGETSVERKTEGPFWYPTHSARREDPTLPDRVGPGKDNPLGTHALYLGWPRYLIHGTNEPYGVGRRVSRGCIRLYPEHIPELFSRVPVGTPVRVIHEQVKLGWVGPDLFLEVHPSLDEAEKLERGGPIQGAKPLPIRPRIERAAAEVAARVDWELVDQVTRERRGIPVRITR